MTDDEKSEMREQLRSGDPASSLSPAQPDLVARLLEETMNHDPVHDESRSDGFRRRSRLTWMVAAAAVVLIAVVGGVTLGRDDEPATPPTAGGSGSAPSPAPDATAGGKPSTTAPDGKPTVTTLGVDGAGAPTGRCMVPTAASLAGQTLAFDGTVESIAGGLVTLVPSTFYVGDETDLVTVEASDRDLQTLLSAVDFEEGERYLVSATDGRVTVCGFSAAWNKQLAATYAEAFPG